MGKIIRPVCFGAAFGVSNIIPGVSSGTMAVIFGCYDIVSGAFALDRQSIKKNIGFLVPFGLGAVLGIFGFAFAARYLLVHFPVPTYLFFLGLIAGSFPAVTRELLSKGGFRPYHGLLIVFGIAVVVALSLLNVTEPETAQSVPAIKLFAFSFIAAALMIVPGISGSFVMILLGIYAPVIAAVTELNLAVLIPAGAGIALGLVLGARLIRLLLKHLHTITYSVITGFVLGSAYVIFPAEAELTPKILIGAGAFILGFALSFIIGRKEKGESKK